MAEVGWLASFKQRSIPPVGPGGQPPGRYARSRMLAPLAALLLSAPVTHSALRAEAVAGGNPAAHPAAKTLALTYEVYAGGLHAFTFNVDLALDPSDYKIAAGGETRGLIGALFKWNVRMMAEGQDAAAAPRDTADGGPLRPQRYVTVNGGRQQPRTMRLDFAPAGAYLVTRDPPDSPDPDGDAGIEDLPSHLPREIFDPLSASLVATRNLAESGRCEQSVPVFDGQRRYDLMFRDAGRGEVPKSRLSVYAGPAIMCNLSMKRISGFAKKRRHAGHWDEDKDEPPTLWIARIREDMPPVPVRFTGAIALGSLVVHLAKVEPGRQLAISETR